MAGIYMPLEINQRSDESAAAEDSTRAAARRPPSDSRLGERRSLKE